MKDLTHVSALLENLISEEVERRTVVLEEEKNRAKALENDYSDYIRFIVKEYNLDLDAQIQKVTKDYEHSEYCDAMAGRYSAFTVDPDAELIEEYLTLLDADIATGVELDIF